MIQSVRCDRDHRATVVTVQMPALSLIVQQPVPVTEVDLASHSKHERLPLVGVKFLRKHDPVAARAQRSAAGNRNRD